MKKTTPLQDVLRQFLTIRATHEQLFALVTQQRTQLTEETPEQPVLVDMIMAAKETTKLIKDMQVEWDAIIQTMEKIVCARWVQDSLTAGGRGEPIRGDLAVGTPSVKSMVTLA